MNSWSLADRMNNKPTRTSKKQRENMTKEALSNAGKRRA